MNQMIEINPSRFKSKPFVHQLEGVRAIVEHPAFYIGDKPRTGKSRQAVDAACALLEAGEIDTVLVIGPIAARGVWCDKDLGQIKRWSWKRVRVIDFHSKIRDVWKDEDSEINWIFSNYEFVRNKVHAGNLCERLRGLKVLLVLDESANLGNRTSQQSQSIQMIRTFCKRCVMFNGSDETPDRYWSQFNILDGVLSKRYKNFTTFKWQFAVWGPAKTIELFDRRTMQKKPKIVHPQVGWKNYEKLSKILAPYTLRRERKDCPELKEIKVISTFKEVQLTKSTWRMYRQLKKDAVLALENDDVYLTPNAGIKILRLQQLCSGHLGGFEDGDPVRNLSNEKLEFTTKLISESKSMNVVAWCRWVRERELLAVALKSSGFIVYQIYGNQPKQQREWSEKIFSEGAFRDPTERYAIVAQPQAGGICLDMAAANETFRLSADYNLRTYEQSKDRPLGPMQELAYVPETIILATGPDGERTVEHAIYAALEVKENIGRWTTEKWRKVLETD